MRDMMTPESYFEPFKNSSKKSSKIASMRFGWETALSPLDRINDSG